MSDFQALLSRPPPLPAYISQSSFRSQRSSSSWTTGTDVEQQSPEFERPLCNFDWDTGLSNPPAIEKTSLAPSSYQDPIAFTAGYSFADEPSNDVMPSQPFLSRTTADADETKDIASAMLDLDANPLQTQTCVASEASTPSKASANRPRPHHPHPKPQAPRGLCHSADP